MQPLKDTIITRENRVYYLGLDAIKEYGIERWRKEYFWPFSIEDYNEILKVIFSSMETILSSDITQETRDIVSIMYFTITKYAYFIHKYLLDSYLETYSYNVISSEDSRYLNVISKIPPPNIRDYMKYTVLNSTNRLFRHGDKALSLGGQEPLKKIYTKKYRVSEFYKPLNKLVGVVDSVPNFFLNDMTLIKEKLRTAADHILDYYYLKHNIHYKNREETLRNLLDIIGDDLCKALKIYLGTKANIESKGFRYVLGSGIGNVFHRMILKSIQRNGGKVVGFNHGNTIGVYYDRALLVTSQVLNTYITSTKAIKGFFENLFKEYSNFPTYEKISIKDVEDDYFLRLYNREKKRPLPRKTKSIMFVEPSLSPYFTMYHAALMCSTQLDLSLRIMEALKRHGYHIIVKLRDERLKDTERGGIYKRYADEFILGGKLNKEYPKYYDKADAFIFTHLFTSAFGFSLATNKKVIYFLYEREKYIKEPLDLLHKRCIPINCWFDERNRIIFDERELIDAVEREHTDIDTEFLKKQIFPS